jgi:hypothetical protein
MNEPEDRFVSSVPTRVVPLGSSVLAPGLSQPIAAR